MSYPILIITGEAGSGKDTVAAIVARGMYGQTIAQADPMKRLAKLIFGFNDDQLWGPSEMRNAPDATWTKVALQEKARAIAAVVADMRSRSVEARTGIVGLESWLEDVLPGCDHQQPGLALQAWLENTLVECIKRGSMTPRYVLQTLGTEWGRNFSKNIWVDYAMRTAQALLNGGFSYDRAKGLVADAAARPPNLVIITDGRFRNEVLAVKAIGGKAWRVDPVGVTESADVAVAKAGVAGHASETEQRGIPQHYFDVVIKNDKSKGIAKLESGLAYLFLNHLRYWWG